MDRTDWKTQVPRGIRRHIPWTVHDDYPAHLPGEFKGLAVTILVSKQLVAEAFPEFRYELRSMDRKLREKLENDSFHYILMTESSRLSSFFGQQPALQAFLTHWKFCYNVIGGRKVLDQAPRTDGHSLRVSVPRHGRDIPIHHPRDVHVQRVMYTCNHGSTFRVKVGRKELDCYVPGALRKNLEHFCDSIEEGWYQAVNGRRDCMPKFMGFVASQEYDQEDRIWVVGLLYEPLHGIPLSELSIPDSARQKLCDRLQKGHEYVQESWRGEGPEDVLVTEDGQLFFAPPERRSKMAKYKHCGTDTKGIDKVMSFLKTQPRPSLRRSERTKAQPTNHIKRQTIFTRLPVELRDMIHENALILPGKVTRVWGENFYVVKRRDPRAPLQPVREWSDQHILKLGYEMESYFFDKNHFFILFSRLRHFLTSSTYTIAIKQITISVPLQFLCVDEQPWREGIEKLINDCEGLRTVQVHIFGAFDYTPLGQLFERNLVLCELRRMCGSKISKIELELPAFRFFVDDGSEETIEKVRRFWRDPELEVAVI